MSQDLKQFRKTVPGDIRAEVGKREIKVSLRTVPLANRPQMHLELDRLCVEAFDNARNGKSFELPNLDKTKPGNTSLIATTTVTPSSGSAPTLSALYENWEAQNPDAAETTKREWKRVVRYFNELHGDVPADQISKTMMRGFRDTLRKLPKRFAIIHPRLTVKQLVQGVESGTITADSTMSETTINKYMTGLAAIFELGRKLELIEHNPASGMKLAVRHSIHDRKAFSPEEIEHLFSQPLFAEKQQDDSCYWTMLLGLYTGARLSEILQLQLDDIKEQDGIWYLDINQEEGKQLKTASSIRKIPLHNDILQLGFVEYVEKCRSNKQKALFAEGEKLTPNQFSSMMSKRLNRFINQCGIKDSKKTYYSLRHSFKDIATLHDIPEEIREALMGHSNQRVSRNYGSGQFIERLNKYVQQMRFTVNGEDRKAQTTPQKRLTLSELFQHTERLEIREVAEILATELNLKKSVLEKILCTQLSRKMYELEDGEPLPRSCTPDAYISEPELKAVLMKAELIN